MELQKAQLELEIGEVKKMLQFGGYDRRIADHLAVLEEQLEELSRES